MTSTISNYSNRDVALELALFEKDAAKVRDTLNNGANPDGFVPEIPGFTPKIPFIHFAVASGSIECVQALIERNVNVNVTNDKRETALFIAMKLGNEAMAIFLCDNGALYYDSRTVLPIINPDHIINPAPYKEKDFIFFQQSSKDRLT